MIPDFYTPSPDWDAQVARIVAAVGRVSASEGRGSDTLELRRTSRIGAVHSSTVIEGNRLSLPQATAVANDEPVYGPARDVQEMQNAWTAYEALESFDPWSVDDFLRAHAVLVDGLVAQAGEFRTVDVEIVNAFGEVVHTGSRSAKVPRLVAETLEWGRTSGDHPLVVSSAVHFLIEHIHPFQDGNGRIGRLWQTLIMSRWRPLFAWMPTETLIRTHQAGYYQALQSSREPEIDAAPFVSFMLDVIEESLQRYDQAAHGDVGINVGIDGRTYTDPAEIVLHHIERDPQITAAQLAETMQMTSRHVERLIKRLRDAGRLTRVGSRKTGHWAVLDSDTTRE